MPEQSASGPKIKGKWMPVRHTENQQHPDWVLFLEDEAGVKQAAGQQPRAVAQCERTDSGAWRWCVDVSETIAAQGGMEFSADLAMLAAGAYILERMKEANAQSADL